MAVRNGVRLKDVVDELNTKNARYISQSRVDEIMSSATFKLDSLLKALKKNNITIVNDRTLQDLSDFFINASFVNNKDMVSMSDIDKYYNDTSSKFSKEDLIIALYEDKVLNIGDEDISYDDEYDDSVNEYDNDDDMEEEIDAGLRGAYSGNDEIGAYLREMCRYAPLSKDKEDEYARRAKNGDTYAKKMLILHNLRLVVSVVKKYRRSATSLSFADLCQEGIFGLMRAVDLFDPDRGYRFSTYATHWIRQATLRGIQDKDDLIRHPVHFYESQRRVKEFIKNYETNHMGELPTVDDISEGLNMSDKVVRTIIDDKPVASLDKSVGDKDDGEPDASLGDFIPSDVGEDPYEAVERSNLRDVIWDCLYQLKDREREVLVKRFGLDGNAPMTLEEVGRYFNVTRERIRQLQDKALRKLREGHRYSALRGFLDG